MTRFLLKDTSRNNTVEFDKKSKAEDRKAELVDKAGANPDDLIIEPIGETDGGQAEVIDSGEPEPVDSETQDLPDEPSVDTDPLQWIPSEFQDHIDGTVAINRKGFEVLAHHYDISATVDMVVSPVETGGDYCVHKAVARNADGVEYTAYGEAYESEEGTDMVRMSDTRAYKRAVSRATGTGMIAVEELQNDL